MKNNVLHRILSAFCAILFVFSSLTAVTAYAAEEENGSGSDIYYCREALKSLPNSEALLFAYDAVVAGVESSLDAINVYNGENAISPEEIKIVFDAYTRDHAEHFWLGKNYSLLSYTETVKTVKPTYIMAGEELAAARISFDNAVAELTSYVDDSMTEYEKELVLHDALASRVVYVETAHAHDSYGALVEGRAVCEGYAEALQCLLHAVEIQSLIATGSSINPSTNAKEGHAWNIVRIDGEYYHTDLTWNDQGSALYHAYFNITDSLLAEDHEINIPAFALPVCDSYEKNYFVKEGDFLTAYDVDSISQMLIRDSLLTTVYISGSTEVFIDWLCDNMEAILDNIGITEACTYSYQSLGHEVMLSINACLHENLTFVPEVEVSCTQNGNDAHYVCECGRYFKDSEASTIILSPETLFFGAYGHNFTRVEKSEEFLKEAAGNCLSTNSYWYGCTRCEEISSTLYFDSDERGAHSPGAPATTESAQLCTVCGEILAPKLHTHAPALVPEKAPTCTEAGKKAYYTCECGKSFIDAEAKKPLINPDNYGNIDPLGHGNIQKNGKCERCGELLEIFNLYTIGIGAAVISLVIILKVLFVIASKARQE